MRLVMSETTTKVQRLPNTAVGTVPMSAALVPARKLPSSVAEFEKSELTALTRLRI